MSIGYSKIAINRITSANKELIGVQLGVICSQKDIPVSVIAEKAGVSRQTVYAWFFGTYQVSQKYSDTVITMIADLSRGTHDID